MFFLFLSCFRISAAPPGNSAGANACTIGASAFVSSTLNCINTSVLLRGNSTTAGVTYSWTGPNGFTSTSQNPTVSAPGIYTLVVTSPAGCTGTATVTVVQNTAPPANVVAATVSGSTQLTCADPGQTLQGSSSTPGASYAWTGPNGFTAYTASTPVNEPGNYTLTVTSPVNGCAATAAVTITDKPVISLHVSASAVLTCIATSVNVVANASVSPANTPFVYNWTGPNGFSAGTAVATVTSGGLYTVTATNNASGCSISGQITVSQDTVAPVLTATSSGPITCSNPQTTITASSSLANAAYLWIGPEEYVSVDAQNIVTVGGDYIVTTSNTNNGCITTTVLTVIDECQQARRAVSPANNLRQNTVATGFEWNAYPNPYREKASISFKSSSADFVTIQVFNSSGVLEKSLFNNKLAPGQSYQLPLTGIQSGMHYIVVRVNNKVYTKKVIVLQ